MAEGDLSGNAHEDFSKYGQPTEHALKYKLLKHIGSGAFGNVIKARHLSTNTLVALKLLRYDPTEAKLDAFKESCNIYKAGTHPNIAGSYDDFRFSSTHHALAMELFDMDLGDFFRLKDNRVIRLMVDVSLQSVTGLAYLHTRKPPLIHRDIKPQNILIKINPKTNTIVAKLSDFGISSILEGKYFFEDCTREHLSNVIQSLVTTVAGRGTRAFLAPEFYAAKDGRGLVNGKFRIDASVDIFALGLVYLFIFFYNCNDYGKCYTYQFWTSVCFQ